MPLASGATFAGFTIVRLLGSGGTGDVYLAKHSEIPQRIALKLLRADLSADLHFRDQFSRAASLTATLNHAHIVGVLGRGESGQRLWLATDYVDGPDAGRLLSERYSTGMPHRAVVMIVDGIAQALDVAHTRGLVHRHVTPANILLEDPNSDAYRIVLTDFGIARRLDNVGAPTAFTAPVEGIGYAAPEQFTGGDLDGRIDQYGLAATAFHLLSGAAAFAPTGRAVGRRRPQIAAPPAALASTHPGLADLDPIFARALDEDPTARFDTCRDFAAALAGACSAGGTAVPTPTLAASRRTATRSAATAPPESSAHTAPANRRLRHLRPVPVVLAVVAVVTTAGLYFSKSRPFGFPAAGPASTTTSPFVSANAAPPLALPTPVCGVPPTMLASLSSRDKLAQLLMVGVTGADDARAVVANQHVGGIFIGSWTDLSMLENGALRDIAGSAGPLPLSVSVDEEGGRVQRLSGRIGSQPSPRVLAANDTAQQVYDIALQRGRRMKDLGITIDFAPVVDVTQAPDDTVIGDRSFGSDPEAVTTYAGVYAKGLRDAGLLPVLKHFPGHGHGSGDSHTGGVTTPPVDDLQNDDLIPYRTLTTESPVAVMVGHLQVPGLTGTLPASLSKDAYDLLRSGGYGGPPFTGLVFTDDLSSIAAINLRYGVAEAVLRALRAGADTALWITTGQVRAVLNRLEQAVNAGELSAERIDDAFNHVAAAKNSRPNCGR